MWIWDKKIESSSQASEWYFIDIPSYESRNVDKIPFGCLWSSCLFNKFYFQRMRDNQVRNMNISVSEYVTDDLINFKRFVGLYLRQVKFLNITQKRHSVKKLHTSSSKWFWMLLDMKVTVFSNRFYVHKEYRNNVLHWKLYLNNFIIIFSAYKNLEGLQKQFKKKLIKSTGAAAVQPSTSHQTDRTDRRRTDDDRDPLRVPGRSNRPPPPEW